MKQGMEKKAEELTEVGVESAGNGSRVRVEGRLLTRIGCGGRSSEFKCLPDS